MLEDFFVVPAAAQRLRDGALGVHLDGFCTRLVELGYRPATIRHTLWVVRSLTAWMAGAHVAVRDLDERRVQEFLGARRRRGRPWRRLVRALRLLLEWLRAAGAVAPVRHSFASSWPLAEAVRRGIEAMGWIVEERGLGGGREMDGLAWRLSLDRLWESYVEIVLRDEAALVGADVRSGRLGQTTFPITWRAGAVRSMVKLVPDFVVRHNRAITVVDAKYKAHLAEIDDAGWRAMTDDVREAHRADVHQALAYAALFDADEVTACLVYPLRVETWQALASRGRDVARGDLTYGGRRLRLELRGLPFGQPASSWET